MRSLLPILGYANSRPTTFAVDLASPKSQVSVAFLFNNSLDTLLDSTGSYHARLTMSAPSQGGFYTLNNLRILSSVTCTADIVLGADWLAASRASATSNVLGRPSAEDRVLVAKTGGRWLYLPGTIKGRRRARY